MQVTQFSVMVENRAGQLAELIECIGREGINIRGIMVAESGGYAEIRFVVNDPVRTERVLKENGHRFWTSPLIAVEMPDRPGTLHRVACILANDAVNIHYVYPLLCKTPHAVVVFRVNENEKAIDLLTSKGVRLLDDNDLSAL